MIKLETHCHTLCTSPCATTPNDMLIDMYKKAGYGAIVVTNHFAKNYYNNYLSGDTHERKVDSFFGFYDRFSSECKAQGIKTFWGTEIRSLVDGQEYMILGLPKEVYYQEPCIFTYPQSKLFEIANKYGAFMYQTHPFREGVVKGDPKFLHGAESFNGHYHHRNFNEQAEKFCLDNNLICMSGTDFHHEDQPITAGIYISEDIETEEQLVKYIFENKFKKIEEKQTYLDALKK